MSHRPADSKYKNTPPEALKRFLKRVVREEVQVRHSLDATPVHDLRVALRRCRSLAEGFGTLDDHRSWRRLHRSAKKLQSGLAGLRDAQVMAQLVRRLKIVNGTAGRSVAEALQRDERKASQQAKRALKAFSSKRWKRWGRRLPKRAEQLEASSIVFARLAMERIREVSTRERRWHNSGSKVAAHSLRIAVKHFRYTVQSFLPEQYSAWERDLKRMQDALGDIHDLDILRPWLLKVARQDSLDHATVQVWMGRIAEARREQVNCYKKVASGGGKYIGSHPSALWERWTATMETLAGITCPVREESEE
jgi:CHAD domain-containing protein